MVTVSGIGSWPGSNFRAALGAVHDLLFDPAGEGLVGMPYLPELPARGPGADMVGRSGNLLVDLPIDLQPQGWRLVDRAGLDAARTRALWRHDLDELAEVFDGWEGAVKIQVVGPWTLASELWLPLGDRVLSDSGAIRDVTESLAAGVADHVRAVQRLLPSADIVVQIDEPSLLRVLHGQLPSASGYRRLPAPESGDASAAVGSVLEAATGAGATLAALHCCATRPPLRVMREAKPGALSIDTTGLDSRAWEGIATAVESGIEVWAGAIPTQREDDGEPSAYQAEHDALAIRWRDIGLETKALANVTVTPACGLATRSPRAAKDLSVAVNRLGRDLAETAAS